MLTFAKESWVYYWPEAQELWQAHYHDAGMTGKMPFGVDVQRYANASAAGMLHITTARNKSKLVGYLTAFVLPHSHYQSVLCAFEDTYFLLPEWRRGLNGARLIRAAIEQLRSIGVQKMYAYSSLRELHRDGKPPKAVHGLMQYLGFTPDALCWSLDLKEAQDE